MRVGLQGPSATLKIKEYSLARDVQAALARPRCPPSAFLAPPLVVLNGFGGDQHLKLTGVLFQNMFPSINVNATKVNQCQVSPPLPVCEHALCCRTSHHRYALLLSVLGAITGAITDLKAAWPGVPINWRNPSGSQGSGCKQPSALVGSLVRVHHAECVACMGCSQCVTVRC